MEKIMQRFSHFNTMLANNSQQDDDDDDGDEAEDACTGDEDSKAGISQDVSDVMKVEKVELKAEEPLEEEFIDNSYWKITKDKTDDDDIDYDSLYAELES